MPIAADLNLREMKKTSTQKTPERLAVFRLQGFFDSICSSHLYTMQHSTGFVYLLV